MSKSFLSDIDFEKESKIIKFSPEDEIKNTDESIELFCEKLNGIIDTHLFLNKLLQMFFLIFQFQKPLRPSFYAPSNSFV